MRYLESCVSSNKRTIAVAASMESHCTHGWRFLSAYSYQLSCPCGSLIQAASNCAMSSVVTLVPGERVTVAPSGPVAVRRKTTNPNRPRAKHCTKRRDALSRPIADVETGRLAPSQAGRVFRHRDVVSAHTAFFTASPMGPRTLPEFTARARSYMLSPTIHDRQG